MGIMSRLSAIIGAKINAIFEGAEDQAQALDYSYEKQRQLLQEVKEGLVEVVTARRRLELQEAKLQENAAKLEVQARQALASGKEDLARLALERRQTVLLQLQGLEGQVADLEREQGKLTMAEERLAMKVEAFRTRKEVMKAQYSAAEARVKIGEAATGLSEEMAAVGLAIERAEDKTEKMKARAQAIDELVATGTLEDFVGGADVVERELTRVTLTENVAKELAAMKASLGLPQPKELPEGSKQ